MRGKERKEQGRGGLMVFWSFGQPKVNQEWNQLVPIHLTCPRRETRKRRETSTKGQV